MEEVRALFAQRDDAEEPIEEAPVQRPDPHTQVRGAALGVGLEESVEAVAVNADNL